MTARKRTEMIKEEIALSVESADLAQGLALLAPHDVAVPPRHLTHAPLLVRDSAKERVVNPPGMQRLQSIRVLGLGWGWGSLGFLPQSHRIHLRALVQKKKIERGRLPRQHLAHLPNFLPSLALVLALRSRFRLHPLACHRSQVRLMAIRLTCSTLSTNKS